MISDRRTGTGDSDSFARIHRWGQAGYLFAGRRHRAQRYSYWPSPGGSSLDAFPETAKISDPQDTKMTYRRPDFSEPDIDHLGHWVCDRPQWASRFGGPESTRGALRQLDFASLRECGGESCRAVVF
ncbi:hypothetical protein K402DRAFT_261573 [Aulographum hederae CBS 113979]|uniref:Uncharacterized protein n=1 Tax=Aulographum hederae CBS 113979 TaxID=1176131 RepID=A0A6G1H911_9PEZI|nr:hypothetical protein K402DRAFT_261573 [Aulographum hederae CBS 113979]